MGPDPAGPTETRAWALLGVCWRVFTPSAGIIFHTLSWRLNSLSMVKAQGLATWASFDCEAESVLAKSGLGSDPSSLISDRADEFASAAWRAAPSLVEGSYTLSFPACVRYTTEEAAS